MPDEQKTLTATLRRNKNKNMECHKCGRPYDESFPDWSICRSCLTEEIPEDSFVDSLGIIWSQKELEEAGGQQEVMKMASEIDVRNNLSLAT
jgi:uncharacterized OB-fold protein